MAICVRVEDLRVVPHTATTPILNDLNLKIRKGERVLLLGPSGAGKSTLLLAISGALKSMDLAQIEGTVKAPASGLLLQNSMDATVGETVFRDVAFGAESAGIAPYQISHLVSEALKSVALPVGTERSTETLSGGELQRLCLAGLLTLAPELLLLDEPTAMLDARSAFEVRSAVGQYLRLTDSTAIIAEHNFENWLPLVQRVIVLSGSGEIIDDGEPMRVLTSRRLDLLRWGLWVPGLPAPAVPTTYSKLAKQNRSQLNLDRDKGEIQAIVGPSGSGKTSRIDAMLNQAIEELGPTAVGWVPQNATLTFAGNTVLESASVTAYKLHGDEGTAYALELLKRLGLEDKLDMHPQELSGGEQRRLALASALAHKPQKLFLDEPTVGQDRVNWLRLVNAINDARSLGVKIVIATHDTHLIAFADDIEQLTIPTERPINRPIPPKFNPSPLGLLGASAMLLFTSFFIDTLSEAIFGLAAVGVAILVALIRGYRPKGLKILLPALVGVLSLGLSNLWLSEDPNITNALTAALRLAYFVIPSLLLARHINAATLGDQLGQLARLPARPVIAGMVALGRVGRLQKTWQHLELVRKLRGLDIHREPEQPLEDRLDIMKDKFKRVFGRVWELTFQLLLQSIRSGTVTAVAMEARGFSAVEKGTGKLRNRTWAVEAQLNQADGTLVAVAAICGLIAIIA